MLLIAAMLFGCTPTPEPTEQAAAPAATEAAQAFRTGGKTKVG